MHLANIVLLDGEPVLFDALEFDEVLATTDTLYELAFLIMDLWEHDLRHQAKFLLNRYLFHMGEIAHYRGLAALPLFLACRAGIRAMVAAQRATQEDYPEISQEEARRHFSFAAGYLEPEAPQLIAIGGLSGTGKSTLAAKIACHIGRVPDAVHLRSDLERKLLFGMEETHRLGAEGYSHDAPEQTYFQLLRKPRQRFEAVTRSSRMPHSPKVDSARGRPRPQASTVCHSQASGSPHQPSSLLTV